MLPTELVLRQSDELLPLENERLHLLQVLVPLVHQLLRLRQRDGNLPVDMWKDTLTVWLSPEKVIVWGRRVPRADFVSI